LVNAEDTIIVRNCKVPVVNSHMRINVDAFGKIEISKDVKITEVKTEKDYSAIVYDNLADRKRFNQFNQYNQHREDRSKQYMSVNDSQSVNTFLS
jgi:hypothetical protein